MHGLCICTLHNSETLEPLTWTMVRSSHCYKCSLAHTCFVLSLLNISKYTTFKPITRLVLSYIDLATYHTLICKKNHLSQNSQNFLSYFVRFFITLCLKILRLLRLNVVFKSDIIKR